MPDPTTTPIASSQPEPAAHDPMDASALLTLEGADKWANRMMDLMRENFENDGELLPVGAMICTKDPKSGEALTEPMVALIATRDAFSSADSKDEFCEFLRSMAEKSAALGYLFGCEAWTVEASARSVRKTMSRSLEYHPARREVIMVTLEHVSFPGTRMWMATITRDAEGKPTLGPFAQSKGSSEGRFTDILHRDLTRGIA